LILFHEGFEPADQAIDLLIGQTVQLVTEGRDPFALKKFVDLRVT